MRPVLLSIALAASPMAHAATVRVGLFVGNDMGLGPDEPLQYAEREARDMARLFLPHGSRGGVRPADLVGALTRGGGLAANAIGAIDVRENVTFFEVQRAHEGEVLALSGRIDLRGRRMRVTKARPDRRRGSSRRGERGFVADRRSAGGK